MLPPVYGPSMYHDWLQKLYKVLMFVLGIYTIDSKINNIKRGGGERERGEVREQYGSRKDIDCNATSIWCESKIEEKLCRCLSSGAVVSNELDR